MALSGARHLVIGAGVHGLSVALHLAERAGPDADVVVLEKDRVGAGASGLAGGIVRNYYRSPAITEIIRDSVEMFEAEPAAYGFRQVGYIAVVPEAQVADLEAIRAFHADAGYESELLTGEERCREYLTWTFTDWTAPAAALLREPRGGWADATRTVRHLAERARGAGVEIREGVEATGFELGGGGVEAVRTSEGRLDCGFVTIAPGPWAARLWDMLGLAPELEVSAGGAGGRAPLTAYWKAQEGEFQLPDVGLGPRAGHEPPVVHLDQAGPLHSDGDGRPLTDGAWGIYFRMGRTGTAITGGGLPVRLDRPELDPYGAGNPAHAAGPEFAEFFTSGLASALRRFRGRAGQWRATLGGGIVNHTPDNYPICDWVLPNAYAIIDSGHGFKMLSLGSLAAADILGSEPRLDPFRLDRFALGRALEASQGPYPWT